MWLQLIFLVVGCAGLVTSVAVYRRQGSWRDRDQEDGRAQKTEIKITQIDQQARDGVDRIEEAFRKDVAQVYQDLHSGDGDIRQAMARMESEMRSSMREQGIEISAIKENIRHLPTQNDLAKLREDVGDLKASSAVNGARLSGLGDLMARMEKTLGRLEEHALNR